MILDLLLKIVKLKKYLQFKIIKTKVDPKTLDIWDKIQENAGIN